MPALPVHPMIAIVNSSDDLLDLLRESFEEEGYTVATAHIRAFRANPQDLELFMLAYNPPVVLWDIALPYEDNWRFFQMIRRLPIMQGRRFILSTTNVQRLREVTGMDEAIVEIVDKPFDLQYLLNIVAQTRAD